MEHCNYLENLPIELIEIIFKYLEINDFLSLCLVSKTLNEKVGGSSLCMSQIWIKFYSFNFKDFDSLSKSVRNYEKLKINRVKNVEHFNYLLQLQQRWKKVLIYNCEFKTFSIFGDLIESLAESVEEIEISDIEILSFETPNFPPLKFSALKRFMFRNVPSKALEIFLPSSDNLHTAAFDIPQITTGSLPLHEITNEILHASPKLKLLQLGPQYIKELFSSDQDFKYEFKLKHLLLKFPIVNDLSEEAIDNISKFLRHQHEIHWMALMELQNDQILTAALNNHTRLKRISFIGLEELFDSEMMFDIEPNLSISHIDFISRKVLISQLRKFLKAAPYLAAVHIKILNKHMLEFIARNHHEIRNLFYDHIEEDVVEVYEQLKNQQDTNKNIKLVKKSFWFNDENRFSLDPIFWRQE